MHKNNDIILIKETQSEYIDKIIIILNENKKSIIPEDVIIKQAENIIFEYERKQNPLNTPSRKKINVIKFFSACFLFVSVLYLLAEKII